MTSDADDLPRLSKRMGELGLCSRREAEAWIVAGWVKVDGQVVDVLGTRVSREARIEVDEDGYEPASVLIRPENRWSGDTSGRRFEPRHLDGLAPAGRLDIDSTGLMVYTQDGRIAKQLIGGNDVEKEYLVRVQGEMAPDGMARLRLGLTLDGVTLKAAQVSWQNEDQLRFGLREGRKRQIRRMCEIVGLTVTGLKRIRTGRVMLGSLPVGQWRYLRADEGF